MPSSERVAVADVAEGEHGDQHRGDQRDHDVVGRLPDPDPLKEGDAERARLGRRRTREGEVGPQQRPAGEEAGLRAERDPREGEHRAGMAEVPREPDERVGDQQHADGGEDEGQRHGPADQARGRDAVERHRGGRGHDRDREGDRLPEAQLSAQAGAAGGRRARGRRRRLAHLVLPVVAITVVPVTTADSLSRRSRGRYVPMAPGGLAPGAAAQVWQTGHQ